MCLLLVELMMEGRKLGLVIGGGAGGGGGSGVNLKDQIVRKTLRNVRLQGHTYVDLREEGKRYIFFCTLCLAPCFNDTVLMDHLRGANHKKRYEAAKVTLMAGENSWPFDDGVLFFRNEVEQDEDGKLEGNDKLKLLGGEVNVENLAIVVHGNGSEPDVGSSGDQMDGNEGEYGMVIPGVMRREGVSDLRVSLIGCGRISAMVDEKGGACTGVRKIWCEWLGEGFNRDEANLTVPVSEFGIVTFVYYYQLGKQGLFEDVRSLLLPAEDSDNNEGCSSRKRKSVSDPEDVSDSLSKQLDSSPEDSPASSTGTSGMMLDHYDDQLLQSRIMPSKKLRRELRRRQRLASERMCGICQHRMLPGKDVATFVNMKTKRLACSRRNVHGAFHVYHTSCLIHWVLFCESEMLRNPPVSPQKKGRTRKKTKGNEGANQSDVGKAPPKRNQKKGNVAVAKLSEHICSVFCPECQGTCMIIEEDELENPTIGLSEMFRYKIKVSDARRAWMENSERLQNCSVGLAFPSLAGDVQARTTAIKMLHIYRSEE